MHEQSASRLAALDQLSDTEVARQAARKSKELLDKFEVETQLELQERSADVVSAFPPAGASCFLTRFRLLTRVYRGGWGLRPARSPPAAGFSMAAAP